MLGYTKKYVETCVEYQTQNVMTKSTAVAVLLPGDVKTAATVRERDIITS